MHIEKRKLKKKTKYYLAHTIRVDNKVRKLRVYLGDNDTDLRKNKTRAEKILRDRIKSYRKISDPFKTVITSGESKEIKSLVAKGAIEIKHLTEDEWERFTKAFVYDTNAIEGSTVTYNEVREILERDKWPTEREKWEISETYGLRDAVEHIRKTRVHVSLALIKQLHLLVFRNSKTYAGKLRKRGQEVAVVDGFGNIVHRGVHSSLVVKLLNDLIVWYNQNKRKYPSIVLAAVVHNQFETIHPFADGNGRVGRLLLNNILLKHNKPPINIELKDRREYYSALREYQETGNLRPIIELILKEYKKLKKIIGTR